MRIKSLAIAAAVVTLLGTGGFASGIANAAPAAPAKAPAVIGQQPELLPVRDRCGRGWYRTQWRDRWGRWHSRCVPTHARGPDRWNRGPWSGGGGGPYRGSGWGYPGWGYYR